MSSGRFPGDQLKDIKILNDSIKDMELVIKTSLLEIIGQEAILVHIVGSFNSIDR